MFKKIQIPGSKSITQRALICASLADGESVLINPLISEDTELLINGLKKLGIEIEIKDERIIVQGNKGKFISKGKKEIYMGNNGTGLRFLITLSDFYPDDVIITGNERMKNRPVDELVECLKSAGFNIQYLEKKGFPPVLIKKPSTFLQAPNVLDAQLSPSTLRISSSKSSQFVSSLLLSGVLFKNGVKIIVNEDIPSKPYIDITLKVMEDFGVKVKKDSSTLHLPPSTYKSQKYIIEGDFSSASYFLSSPFFINREVVVENINYYNSLQPDKHFIDVLKEMGAKVEIADNATRVSPGELNGIEVDMNKMPDVVPTLSVLASISNGKTLIKNIEHLRFKESDRIFAIKKNLEKFGIDVEAGKDFLKITGNRKKIFNTKRKIIIETFNDHRIAMSFALFKLSGLNVEFDNYECVSKSFPNFWNFFEFF